MSNYYRIIGHRANGSVVDTVICDEDQTEAAHDKMMEHPEVRTVYSAGPFPKGKK